jgi:hypothetical protein
MEIPSANAHATARAMAAVMNILGAGGERNGVKLLSPEGFSAAIADPVCLPTFFGKTTEFTNAGMNIFRAAGPEQTGPGTLDDRKG